MRAWDGTEELLGASDVKAWVGTEELLGAGKSNFYIYYIYYTIQSQSDCSVLLSNVTL